MTRKWSWLSGALGAVTVATTIMVGGCRIQGQARAGWYVSDVPPPADQVEAQPEARPGYVWVKGHWINNAGRWEWQQGRWEQQIQQQVWVDGRWEQRNNRWFWVEGHWQAGGGTYVDNSGVGTPGSDVVWEVEAAPPAEQIEQEPAPRSGYAWVRGAWEFRGGQWQWRTGHWEAQQATGGVWVNGRWEQRGNRWVWSPGRWDVNVTVGGSGTVWADSAPPAPQQEMTPAARPGYIWVQGRWEWANNQWQWRTGFWQVQQPQRHWVQGRWQNQNNRWMWVEGHWE